MDRVNGEDFIDLGGGKRGFRDEDLLAGIAGTEITAAFLNSIQEEIANVIEDAGIVLSVADRTQLLQALNRREASRTTPYIPVVSVSVTAPPGGPAVGQAYVIPPGATGAWAGKSQQIAQWTATGWRYIDAPNGHVVGTPDGTQYTKLAGTYTTGATSRAARLFYGCL